MIELTSFTERHAEEAAKLFTSAYRHLRASFPYLPVRHEDPAIIGDMLSQLSSRYPGVVALSDGIVVGYLLGMYIPAFKGPHPGIFCPEWANAVAVGNEDAIYTALFQHLSPEWKDKGAVTYGVSLLAGNKSTIDAWFWNGFGLAVVDAVRPAVPIDIAPAPYVHIRQAADADLAAVHSLLVDHNSYMSAAPVNLLANTHLTAENVYNRMNQPNQSIWIAELDGNPVGLIEVANGVSGAADIVSGGCGLSIKCAHVLSQLRGRGIGTSLLNTALVWANERGVQMCSVDFEAYNPTARKFWLRHFSPVCFSVIRSIDERTVLE